MCLYLVSKGVFWMKLLLTVLMMLCCLFAAIPAFAQEENFSVPEGFDEKRENTSYGKMVYFTYPSQTTGWERKCYVILPVDYDETKSYPVLYLLHGIGGDHSEWLGGKPDVVIGNLVADGLAKDMIVVLPNVRARMNDAANPADIYSPEHFAAFDNFINDLKNDLMPYMAAHYSIATGPENTAIAGLSMGGREALYIGLSMPETFGYIGAFTPAPGILPYNAEAGLFTPETLKAAEGYTPFILINAGKSDGVVGAWPETYSSTLTTNGTKNVFYVTEGGHVFTVWRHGLYHFAKNIFVD